MKIGFFGTPDIALYCLEELFKVHEICFVVTQPDKKTGRNQHMQICPAKHEAQCHDIPVLQPESLNDPAFFDQLNKYDAQIYVVVAYGKLIPRAVFDYPPLKTINLHPSLLPAYRGAAPLQWVLINGERETGVSVQLINERMDAGDIIRQEKVAITDDMTAADLSDAVLPLGVRLLNESIELLASGKAVSVQQKDDEATYCGKITRETARIDWTRSAVDIHNLVRGLNPKPVAWTTFRSRELKVWKTSLSHGVPDTALSLRPGEMAVYGKKRLMAGTGKGILELVAIQPETKKTMDGLSFINGYRPADTDCMG
ncbi:MAG: methionyl-tRNA formyltransferase [Spirochaetae bacterium HGW-Spirochaetae-1]|jgi:methionyl-tRNA formyltransferase|nr:MAG: methionyl-tRNA formyltransferase [Spirochaetae bacterium HGW-Spirochaetae-1]